MGSGQSRESNNGQRTHSRNFTEAEVRRALVAQKTQLESEMNNLLRSQLASAKAEAASTTPASTSSSIKSQRVACTTSNVTQNVNEKELAPYSQTPNNLAEQSVNERERAPYSQTPNNQQGVNERDRAPYSQTPNNQQGVNERDRAPYSHTPNNQQGLNERDRAPYSQIPNNQQGVNERDRAPYSQIPNNQQGVNERDRAPYSQTPNNQQGVNERDRAPYSQTPNNQQGVNERDRAPYSQTPNNQQGVNERERAPYSHTPNILAQKANQTKTPLYPTLPTNGNQAPGTNYSPQNPVYSVSNNNRQYGPTSPSAPPMPSVPARQGRSISRSPSAPPMPSVPARQGRSISRSPSAPPMPSVPARQGRSISRSPSAPPMPSVPARQGRSISRNPGPRQKAESDDVACPTCKYRYTEKIFNCESGHASCFECMATQQPCGKYLLTKQPCARRITDMRNIMMEEYVTQKQISCPNADEGCTYIISQGNLEQHLQNCPFKEVRCMLPGDMCRWKGKLSKLAEHFDKFHPDCRGEIDTETFLPLKKTNKTIQLIKIGNYNFIVHQYTDNDKVFIAAQLIGTKGGASKWCYELHVFKKAEPTRKYVYVDKCFSLWESFDDILKECACAVLPMTYAKTFDNGGGDVVYKYYIKKEVGGSNDREDRKRDVSCNRGGRGRRRGRGGFAN